MRPSHRRHDRAWRPGPKAWFWRKAPPPTRESVVEILKRCYPSSRQAGEKIMEPPPYAELAYARHWVSRKQFDAIPKVWLGKRHADIMAMLRDAPMFGLLKRRA